MSGCKAAGLVNDHSLTVFAMKNVNRYTLDKFYLNQRLELREDCSLVGNYKLFSR